MAREQGLYVGDRTLTAELARKRRLYEGLRGTAGQRLATMMLAILGRKLPGVNPQAPEIAAHARAVLRWRGYDPETHTLSRNPAGVFPGLVIRDDLGRPCEGLRGKRLAALENDEAFLTVYAEELQSAGLI